MNWRWRHLVGVPVTASAVVLLLSACSDYSYSSKTHKDVFQQRRRNTVDVLVVVDNSCSMAEEQNKLAANFESFIAAFDGIEDVDWQIAVVTTDMETEGHQGAMKGGDDEIILSAPDGRVLDRVSYDAAWSVPTGASMQLSSGSVSTSGNDAFANWCVSTAAFGDGDLGTPGAENAACTSATDVEDAHRSGDGSGTVLAGDIVITEFLADPSASSDVAGEWVELTNLTDFDIDLSGYLLSDAGRNSAEIPAGTVLPADGRLVVGRELDVALNGGAPVDVAIPTGFTLNDNVLVLTPDVEGPGEIFSEMVAVGVTGSGIEMGLDAARAALSEPLLSTVNSGFLRDDANLSIIFVSDENDFSRDPTSDYYTHFAELKGDEAYRDHGILNFSAVVGRDVPPSAGAPACESSNGMASYGARYIDLASRTDGALESICDEDFTPIATELGLLVSGLDLDFVLTEPCNETTLEVALYADETATEPFQNLEMGVDYSFDIGRNAIVFDATQVPPSEVWIVAEYQVLARSAGRDEEGTTE